MSGPEAEVRGAVRLYYDSPELTFAARVTDIQLVAREASLRSAGALTGQLWRVSLDRTAFYPESGGQPWDTGVLVARARGGAVLEVPVERVEEDEAGEVWHFVRKPLAEGTEIEGRVDADRRRDHMQQHTGQHLLSAVLWRRSGARTVSFHLGAETSTVDVSLPEGVKEISREALLVAEEEVNQRIFENRRVRATWCSREEAEGMLIRGELRKLPDRPGVLRVVEMEGVEWNACGGTHVAATGSIGGLMVRGVEKVKRDWRIEFVCGLRAVRTAGREYAVLSGVAKAFSVGVHDVSARAQRLLADAKSQSKERQALLDELAAAEARWLERDAEPGALIEANFAGKSLEFATRVAAEFRKKGRGAVIGVEDGTAGAVVFLRPSQSSVHAGERLKMLIETLGDGVRGGGSTDLAQLTCRADQVGKLCRLIVEDAKSSAQISKDSEL